jgi:hypothetical protein
MDHHVPPPAERHPRQRTGRFVRIIGWLILAVLLWSAWAGYALYDLARALDDDDAVALARRIDWTSVREGLREDVSAKLAAGASRDASRTVEALTSSAAISHLIRNAKFGERGWDIAAPADAPNRGFEWVRVAYAFFSGGPFAVRVDIRPDSDSVKQPLVLLFKWNGDWQLARVFLPSDARIGGQLASQAPPRAQPAQRPAAAEPAPASGAASPKALLFEEDASDPQGKSYTGSVTWRAEQVAGSAGSAPEIEVRADVSMPDRPLRLALAIRRNTDRNLPASHIIDVKIDVPKDSSTGGIQDVPGILLNSTETGGGMALAGIAVKVSGDYFMIGLSSIEIDVKTNMDMLKQRPWLAIPLLYSNKRRALLSLEKGEAGTKSIAEALARWSSAPIGNNADQKN